MNSGNGSESVTSVSRGRWRLSALCSLLLTSVLLACVPLPASFTSSQTQERASPTPIVVVVTPTAIPAEVLDEASAEDLLLINLYERVNPSVVNIEILISAASSLGGDLYAEGEGSGFIIDKEGRIVTNNHVVEGAEEVQVTLYDGTMAEARVLGTDPHSDLAVIQIDLPAELLHPVQLGDSDQLRVGQRVISSGHYDHPQLGIKGMTITPFLVKALDLPVQSGVLVSESTADGPADKVGIRGGTTEVSIRGNLVRTGGDIIVSIDGYEIEQFEDLLSYIVMETEVGQEVALGIVRDGEERVIKVALGARPEVEIGG